MRRVAFVDDLLIKGGVAPPKARLMAASTLSFGMVDGGALLNEAPQSRILMRDQARPLWPPS